MKNILAVLAMFLCCLSPSVGADELSAPGIVKVTSGHDFATTVERLESAIKENPKLTLLWKISHSDNAKSAELELRPTTLLVFGNPEIGTPLMEQAGTLGLDLPQKFLVMEEEGKVVICYNDPEYLARRHGLEGQKERLDKIAGALKKLSHGAASE